jgi:hypothetical protein
MGSLLTTLLLSPRKQESTTPPEVLCPKHRKRNSGVVDHHSRWRIGSLFVGAVEAALAGVLTLLLVTAFVAFFYLYCLPLMGAN